MNQIERLIFELCPDGVKFKTIDELFVTKNGYTPSKSNLSYWDKGTVPWFRMDDIRKNGRILGESLQQVSELALKGGKLFPGNSIIIATTATIGEHALISVPHLANQQFTSLALRTEFVKNINMRFVFYYCFLLGEWCRKNTNKSSFASVNMNGFKRFRFPIPPLEIQNIIVKILDTFTELEAKLETEIEAEIEARKKQYQYYRNTLMTFDENTQRGGVKWTTLGEIGTFIRGTGINKSDFTESGIGCIHYGQIHTHFGVWAKETKSYINPQVASRLRKAKSGDLVIATTSEDDDAVAKAVAWIGVENVAISTDAYIFQHSLNPKYLSYFFQTEYFHKQKKPHITGTSVRRISGKSLSKIPINIPSNKEQERIVSILDKFDSLVNDLSIGLPAEIKARRQQYEYYRDKLLTFKEAA